MDKSSQRLKLYRLAEAYCSYSANTGFPFLQQGFCDDFASAFGLYRVDLHAVQTWHRPEMESREVMRKASVICRNALSGDGEFDSSRDNVYIALVDFYNKRLSLLKKLVGAQL